ncbi:MAG: sigma-70 family RNA polymerase sigma factor [Myxococcota bacterium]
MQLDETFLHTACGAWDAETRDPSALSQALESLYDQATAAWPGVKVEPAAFVQYLADRAPDLTDPIDALEAMHGVDLFLALACANGDPAAHRHFENAIVVGIGPAVSRIDKDPEFVREVEGEVRIKLLVANPGPPRISSYLGRGPLRSWVQVAAIRTAYSLKRKVRKEPSENLDKIADQPFVGDNAELAHIRAESQAVFAEAFEKAMAELDARQRNVLRLYLLDEVSAEAIGRMYQVHRATVARWIARAQATVLSSLQRTFRSELKLSESEFNSLMRLVQSQLHISIATVLQG